MFQRKSNRSSLKDKNSSETKLVNQDDVPEDAAVGRNLGWTSAVMMIFSRMIGSGVFATPGTILITAGSPGMSLVLWTLGSLISFCGLAVLLEFGTMLPKSGGVKLYLEYVYKKPRFLASTVFAIQALLLGITASNCIVFAQYTLYALDIERTAWNQKSLAVGVIILVTLTHGYSLKTGIRIQNTLGFIKMFLLLFMVLTGLTVLITGRTRSGPSQLEFSRIFEGTETNLSLLSMALFKVLYSFSGYGNVNNVMNEVRNPVRTLKSAAPVAVIIVAGTYLLINLAYFSVVPIEEVKESGQLVAALFFTRVFGYTTGRVLLPGLIAISALGNLFVAIYSESRINQEIARQGFFPYASIVASNRPFNSPLGGLIVHLVPSILMITLPPAGDVYAFILDVVGYPAQFTSIAVAVGLLLLRKREPHLKRPFRAWSLAVYIQILVSLALLLSPFMNTKEGKGDTSFWYGTYAVVGTSILAFSFLYWFVWIKLLPWWKGYILEQEVSVLGDGTTVKHLVKLYV
ncbi:putative methionine permease [Morchella snyderi]|nr:putative methionine permease [Morchella snyderi]